jgi:hypothetical protein
MPGPGRPPAPPLDLDATKIAELIRQSEVFAKDKGKLKAWLAPKRIFHVLFQDHLSTLPIPGGKGVVLNAQSSKLFLEMSEPLAAALEGVEDEEDEVPTPGVKQFLCGECGLLWLDGRTKCEHRITLEDGGNVVRPDFEEPHAQPPSQRRVDKPAQRKRRVVRRKPARKNPR